MPASAIKRFSRRTELIEKVAAERGITDAKKKDGLGAETREKKNKELSWDELRTAWDSQLTDEERQFIDATNRREIPFARPVHGEGEAVDHALEHCFTREAVVAERKLLTEALKRGIGSVTVEGVKRELFKRPLIRGDVAGTAMATTDDMRKAEARLIAIAREGRGQCRPLARPDRPITREWLKVDQKAAVRHVLGSRDRVYDSPGRSRDWQNRSGAGNRRSTGPCPRARGTCRWREDHGSGRGAAERSRIYRRGDHRPFLQGHEDAGCGEGRGGSGG